MYKGIPPGTLNGKKTKDYELGREDSSFETILITCYLIKSNSSEIMSVKLATYLLIRGGISKEAPGDLGAGQPRARWKIPGFSS